MADHFLNIPIVYRLGTRWVGRIPAPVSYAIAGRVADLSRFFYRGAVNNVRRNLSLPFPEASEKELSAIIRRIFRNYGKYLVDYGRLAHVDNKVVSESIVTFRGRENLEAAMAINKGIILLTAHLGNWELGGIFFGSLGLKMNVVTIRDKDSEIGDSRKFYRERYNVRTITIGDSPFSTLELVEALRKGELVAMLIDRYHGRADNVRASFFNRPTLFPQGPFTLSRLTGAPIVPAFVVKEAGGYLGIVGEPYLITGEEAETFVIGEIIKTLEHYIVKYADQWYNFVPV